MVEQFFSNIFSNGTRFVCWIIGAIWGLLSPTIPFALICLFAIILDCISAWKLGRRVAKKHPQEAKNADKLKSEDASKMAYTLLIIYACTFLGWLIDKFMYPFVDLYLANFISGGFCMVQLLSILENESSCNGARWAKVLQKVLVDKTARHLNVEPGDLTGTEEEADGKS